MAFCNSCGATLNEGAAFCSKCGAATGTAAPRMSPATSGPVSAPPKQDNSAVKTVLIVVGVIVVLGVIAIATLTFVGLHIAKKTRVTQDGDNVRVETPFGRVETSKDPEQAAKDLGIDIYPGAEVQKNGASTAVFGGVRTSTAVFESEDSTDKVCSFYREKFPNAKVSASEQNHCAIVSQNGAEVVTINVDRRGDGCRFQITTVNRHAESSSQ